MIVISLKRFLISMLLLLGVTVFLIITGMDLQSGEPVELRIDVQNLLFWGITALLVQGGIGVSILLRYKNILNELERIARIGDINHPHAEKILSQMGRMGSEIGNMMRMQNDMSVMRSDRINALNSLVKLLSADMSDSIVITDVKGDILGISNSLSAKIKKGQDEISFRNLRDILPEIKLTEVLGFLEKQKLPWKDSETPNIVCVPVFDKKSNLHFCLWELESGNILSAFRESIGESRQNGTLGRFQELWKKRPVRKKKGKE